MPRKTLIITDVTAMSGDNVCIAGYDDSLICIRPVLSRGQIRKRHLFKDGDLIIFPGAKVAFNFSSPISQPPHVEDIIFEEASIESIGRVSDSIVYLRLGLTRPFSDAPGKYAGWCCLQVNGIHTFPDFYERDYAKWIRLE